MQFVKLCLSRKSRFTNLAGETVAFLDTHSAFEFSNTVRSTARQLLLPASKVKCAKCVSFRSAMRLMIRRASDNTPNKFASNAFLRSPQLRKKAKRLATVLKSSQQRLRRLTAKVQRLIQHEGVNLTSENSADSRH